VYNIYDFLLDKPECSINLREVEGKTRLICEVKANPKLVDFVWMFNNTTLSKDIVHLGLQSMLILDGPPPSNGIFYCYVNNSVGLSTPCEINIAGEFSFLSLNDHCFKILKMCLKNFILNWNYSFIIVGGLLAKLGDENIIIIAVIAAAIVVILVVCIVLLVLCQRKRAEDKCKFPSFSNVLSDQNKRIACLRLVFSLNFIVKCLN